MNGRAMDARGQSSRKKFDLSLTVTILDPRVQGNRILSSPDKFSVQTGVRAHKGAPRHV